MPEYLSRDPQAGTTKDYLSTDPTAGEAMQPAGGNPIAGLATGGALAAAPGAVSLLNRVAGVTANVAGARAAGVVPAFVALDAAGDVVRGDHRRAAAKVGAAAASTQVPRVLRAVQAATAPTGTVAGGASSVLTASGNPWQLPASTVRAGMFTRLANAMARFAGPAGLAVETLFGPGAAGHRPAGETPATTAARQAEFQRQYDAMRGAK